MYLLSTIKYTTINENQSFFFLLGTTNRLERDVGEDIENWGNDIKDSLWGGRCISDSGCSVVSHCDGGMYYFTFFLLEILQQLA